VARWGRYRVKTTKNVGKVWMKEMTLLDAKVECLERVSCRSRGRRSGCMMIFVSGNPERDTYNVKLKLCRCMYSYVCKKYVLTF